MKKRSGSIDARHNTPSKAHQQAVWRKLQHDAKYKGIILFYGQRNNKENNNSDKMKA